MPVHTEWDRATRSMLDGIAIMTRVYQMGALVKVLDRPYLDLTTPIGQGFLAFLSALAQDERDRINRRANDGRREAKRLGIKFGRKPKLTEHQRGRVRDMLGQGMKLRAIAREFNVHHSTISKLKM